jgi:hypothetical protein
MKTLLKKTDVWAISHKESVLRLVKVSKILE